MSVTPAAPFYGFRFSSATSVDVKLEKDSEVWAGLVSICGVATDELLRQAKSAFPGAMFKAVFLAELPRILTWSGCSEPHTEGDSICFTDGQKLECELEDPSSGEIGEETATCSAEKYEAVMTQRDSLLAALNDADSNNNAGSEAPRVGLDAMGGFGNAGAHDEHDEDEDDDDEYEDHEGDDEDDEDESDLKNGLGKDISPSVAQKTKALKDQLSTICSIGSMLGLPHSEIRGAFLAAGGIIPEDSSAYLGHDEDEHEMHGGGGVPQAGGCKQQ